MIKKSFPFALLLCFGLIFTVAPVLASKTVSGDKLWRQIDNSAKKEADSVSAVGEYKVFRLDKTLLRTILDKAPHEFQKSAFDSASNAADSNPTIITLPLPDGTYSRFTIKESPVMEAELARKYPEIATFIGQGVDIPNAVVRLSYSPAGFRAMILSNKGTVIVDPQAKNDTDNYISFVKADAEKDGSFVCETHKEFGDLLKTDFENSLGMSSPSVLTNGSTLRIYRLALAATAEYTNVFRQSDDTDAQAKARALEQQVIIMNRVNSVFERDFAVRMVLVATNDQIIYTNPDTDPYTNSDGAAMLGQNQTNLNTVIGSQNFDVGHVFSTGGGGRANVGVPCGPWKARGVTGRAIPTGDPFAIDYVAHEIGHQFGANHTFNGTVSSCGGDNRATFAAYEPGSGITVMGYAGICGNQNLARNSIDTFHIKSLEEVISYVTNPSTGASCGSTVETGNSAPSVALIGTPLYNIPKQTPFVLSAMATDANNDSITYDWQQYDLGGSTNAVPNTDSDGTARPLFRAYQPKTTGTRIFPSLQYILNNGNVPPSTTQIGSTQYLTGELLPSIARTMNFQVVARDNRAGGGGVNTAPVQIVVDAASGPFVITSPNNSTSWNGNSTQTISWDVANTTAAPVNAQMVRITLSTDGGQTFPVVLKDSTANDGTETVTIPNTATTTGRIRIEAIGNIFFDINDSNFTILETTTACSYSLSSTNLSSPAAGGAGNVTVTTSAGCAWSVTSNVSWIVANLNGSGSGTVTINVPVNTGQARIGTLTIAGQTFTINQAGISSPQNRSPFDFDGDNKTDISIYRPAVGEWWYQKSSNGGNGAFQFGSATDKLVPADFTGDGKTDIAFWRPSTGEWFVLRSEDSSFYSFPFGASGDVPVPADFDADGKADPAVFRSSTNTWFISKSTGGTTIQSFGQTGDVPVVADYDGDNKADIAIYRPSKGEWWINRSSLGAIAFQFGVNTDKPVQADFTGDGKADVAFFRPATNEWYVLRSENQSFYSFPFGAAGDIASPGDYDGDGRADAAVFRPSNNTWFVQRTTSGTLIQTFGQTGDKSVPNAFVP
ncbi:MAG TPA: zinc-dependent metalloprotease family protein [Pyrinomonadaceae bacterium]|jgi:hypothetical protein